MLFGTLFISLALAAPVERYTDITPPEAQAFLGWHDVSGYTSTTVDPFSLPRVGIRCSDKALYPPHPLQDTKLYHEYKRGTYNHARMDGNAEACLTRSAFPNSQGKYTCLRPDSLDTAVLSDLLRDRCGNLYRAVWRVSFLRRYDNMGMLSSLGRSLFRASDSAFTDIVPGHTYSVTAENFMFLVSPLAGDFAATATAIEKAKRTHNFDPHSLLFKRK